ncbi:hypothetical protein HUW52_17845 [Pseudomonas sp. 43A]|uniref:hypothetical protein n=1 Tax=unclassified Pseudomonas TaxID=196821 RepID=UPI0015879580|nr:MULTISPECIES: hypothetical protein [unclassified Pseudomonas]QKV64675.1 hypothetical protein HUW52_17845 [Pseudomonas sp. 43A]QMW12871.1 hypothetical protein H3303_14855 [Pseudomonas sp. 29A]
MPTKAPITASSTLSSAVLLSLPRVDGVDPQDPAGTLPPDAKQVGIVCVIDRWLSFPVSGARKDRVEIFIVGNPDFVAWAEYGVADDAVEFRISVAPEKLPDVATFELFYTVRSINPTTSEKRRLTYAIVAPPQRLKEAGFPDADIWGYIGCHKNYPDDPESLFIWEGGRVEIPFDDLFDLNDVLRVYWQAWGSLYGPGELVDPLTPEFEFNEVVTDVVNKQAVKLVIKPFASHIEPMRNNHSATVNYQLLRNGIPIFRSFTGLVKVDRVIPGQSEYCADSSWMT